MNVKVRKLSQLGSGGERIGLSTYLTCHPSPNGELVAPFV